jgi:KUP system potassium uptake protein
MSSPSSTEHAPGDGHDHRREAVRAGGAAALTLGALGVVFGDIGTSPLYALQSVFSADHHAVHPTRTTVYGVISLVFWTITIIVSLKYVILIMRADNEGEGGIMALIAKVQAVTMGKGRRKHALILLGIFGAALFYGDGMITPAISVLSAVEGLEIVSPSFEDWVVPITLAILTALFAIQRFGTGAVGRAFGPVMAVWFSVLALTGLVETVQHPGIVRALSPTYAIAFLGEHGGTAFVALGSVVLTVTGAEALYADMGHFGRAPIRRAWFALVFPALLLQYLGQGALLLRDPEAIDSPFFLLMPHWARIPVVVLATFATVIASQAVISGAFSVTRQAVRLGFLPRVTIRHTSRQEVGQVYAPAINWGIFAAVVALVLGFRSSEHLASAYGIAVTGTLAIDTVLFFVVVHVAFGRSLRTAVAGAAVFLLVDLTYFAANLPKVVHGGWFPLLIAAAFFVVLSTWQRGRQVVTANRTELEGPLRAFVDEVHAADPPVHRAPRTGVFLNATATRRRWRCARTSSTTTPCTRAWSLCRSSWSACRTSARSSARRSTTSATRTTASSTSPRATGSWTTSTSRGCCGARPRAWRATSTSSTSPTSSRGSRSSRPRRPAWPAGASACSSRWRATPPTRWPTSACPTTARSSWAPTSRCRATRRRRRGRAPARACRWCAAAARRATSGRPARGGRRPTRPCHRS